MTQELRASTLEEKRIAPPFFVGDKPSKSGCPYCGSPFQLADKRGLHYECGASVHLISMDSLRTMLCMERGIGYPQPIGQPRMLNNPPLTVNI